jgi:hypothetical protein
MSHSGCLGLGTALSHPIHAKTFTFLAENFDVFFHHHSSHPLHLLMSQFPGRNGYARVDRGAITSRDFIPSQRPDLSLIVTRRTRAPHTGRSSWAGVAVFDEGLTFRGTCTGMLSS